MKLSDAAAPSFFGRLRHMAAPFLWALIAAIVIRTFVFQPFSIPSSSMLPTLLVGDHLFVAKYAYGYSRYALPSFFYRLAPGGRLFGSLPERGDVIVFRLPADDSVDYIKRVIGLPGDRVQMIGGVLHINGAAARRETVAGGSRYRERLPDGAAYEILDVRPNSVGDTTRIFLVPEDHLFVMGDNRDNSVDSRVQSAVGFVPAANIVGRAWRIYISVGPRARWFAPWSWLRGVRWGRSGQKVGGG